MKKFIYLIPLFLLFLIPKVYALPNCSSISSATLYDVYNANSVGSITTNSTNGSSLLCKNAWYTGATSDNTQGLGWEVKLTDLNAKDFYYQLNVYYHMENVGGGTPNIQASPFRFNNIAVGTSNASSLWTSGNLGVSDLSYTINTYSIENGYTYFVVSYIFKANVGFNRVFLPFSTSYMWTGSFWLSGIDITNIGSKSLSSNEINSLLANQSSQIQNDINNMKDSINDTINDNFNTCRPSKNLFDKDNPDIVHAYPNGDTKEWILDSNGYSFVINVEPNTDYTISKPLSTNIFNVSSSVSLPSSGSFATNVSDGYNKTAIHITTGPNDRYLIVYFAWSYESINVPNLLDKVMVEKGNSASIYEPYGEICQNKIDETNDKLDGINSSLNDLNSSMNNSDSSGATGSAGSFFNNFEDNDFGLSGIITAPLNTIKTITSNACTPINLTIPFVNKNMSLPCMTDIYEEHFGSFLEIYQLITFGMISYWVCVQIYAMVKGFKNPDKDEIEVMDL